MSDHIKFMDLALQQAEEALQLGEVPIGCVFVYENQPIAHGKNSTNETKNATRHAEINAVDMLLNYCQKNGLDYSKVLPQSTLYVTVEPCAMCTDAIAQLNVGNLVFGCCNDRFGGCGSIVDVLKMFNYKLIDNVLKGIKAEEAVEMLRKFYKGTNPNAPTDKTKRKQKIQNS